MRFIGFTIILALFGFCPIDGANILGLFTVPSKSHSILGYELFKGLVKLGHQVTVITPEGSQLKNPPENYTNIVIGGELTETFTAVINTMFDEVDDNPILKINTMLNQTLVMTKYFISHPKVQNLLKSEKKFDLVISELAMNEALLGFSEFYKCPHILISTVGATSWVSTITGNPAPASYIPHVFLDFTDKMNLLQRLQNTFFGLTEDLLMHTSYYPHMQEIYENSFPKSDKTFRPFWDKMKHGVCLVLLNSHYSMSFPRPYLPNLIEVGGMHIKKKTNPLPGNIQKFIDESEHGVVYFSLGGNLNPSVMPKEKQEAIIRSLSKLKQRILWKWDDPSANVDKTKFLIQNWFPQDDILANPNVKVFVTHGGLLGGTEAIYYGKPLVTIPIFGDQKLNAARSSMAGYGVRIDYSNLTETSFSWALNEVINNKKYTERVKDLSARFRDKPQHPLDLALFYTEYVMRHKGALFMQSSSTYLNFIQLYNLDVYTILLSVLLAALICIRFVIKKLLSCVFGGKTEKVVAERKQKKVKRN